MGETTAGSEVVRDLAELGDGDHLVEIDGRFTIRSDGWYGVDADCLCPTSERFRYAVCFHDYKTRSEALAWYEGYQAGARENQ